MNIQSINGMNNNTFGARIPQKAPAKIEIVGKIDNYAEQMLDHINGAILHQADSYGRDIVKVAQKGDALYINSGTITSRISLSEEGNNLFKNVVNNIQANSEAEYRGLDKGFSRLA